MSTLIADLQTETETLTITGEGVSAVRSFMIRGVTGNADDRMYNAAQAAGLPVIGAQHPNYSTVFCSKKDFRPASGSNSDFICIATYEQSTGAQVVPDDTQVCDIEIGVTGQTEETNYDGNGDLITVSYVKNEKTKTQVATISVDKPFGNYRFSRLEPNSPEAKAQVYSSTVNDAVWRGQAAGRWLCRGINATKKGENYWVTYEFQLNPSDIGWSQRVYYKDPDTGLPPEDISDTNGIEVKQGYPSANFSALNIP